ncbi:hypothetical protein [Candidatus Phytoplasma meliae]|uniref:Uncharacterized protein n=1 Tax=Candidatus Phytoplasma meliae TaxID=1848402 RepID=A0ABS5CZ23_9MOLU|nr:hypothetical protein [Candidatus Phytoplasma meliae]MBP5836224.1 hypothetical protein [Candidatus Phytoplasma meliae]
MNFLKKHWVTILVILFFSIVIIIGFFEGIHKTKQEQKSLSNYHEELEDNKESKQPSRNKRDTQTPKSKIKITKAKYDQIKSYILSENEYEILPFNNLTEEEITVIEKARNKQKRMLKYRKKNLNKINEYQQECDNYNKQISKLDPKKYENKIEALNGMLSNAIKLKDSLQREYDNDISRNTYGYPLENINSLYEITPSEG